MATLSICSCATTNAPPAARNQEEADGLRKQLADLSGRVQDLESRVAKAPAGGAPTSAPITDAGAGTSSADRSSVQGDERAHFLAGVRSRFDQGQPNDALEQSARAALAPYLKNNVRGLACRDSLCELRLHFDTQAQLEAFYKAMFFRPEGPLWQGSSTSVSVVTDAAGVSAVLFLGARRSGAEPTRSVASPSTPNVGRPTVRALSTTTSLASDACDAGTGYFETVAATGYPQGGLSSISNYWSVNTSNGFLQYSNTSSTVHACWVVPLEFAACTGARSWSASVFLTTPSSGIVPACRLYVIPTNPAYSGQMDASDWVSPPASDGGLGGIATMSVTSSFNGGFVSCNLTSGAQIGNVEWSY